MVNVFQQTSHKLQCKLCFYIYNIEALILEYDDENSLQLYDFDGPYHCKIIFVKILYAISFKVKRVE